jgi:hypothetical protein
MTERIAPNPYSPYADADPTYRHAVPSLFGTLPTPGGLTVVACGRMAVVPTEPLQDAERPDLPEGFCPACITVMNGGRELPTERGTCKECGHGSSHGDLCALCRQELHDTWWPTRDGGEPGA